MDYHFWSGKHRQSSRKSVFSHMTAFRTVSLYLNVEARSTKTLRWLVFYFYCEQNGTT